MNIDWFKKNIKLILIFIVLFIISLILINFRNVAQKTNSYEVKEKKIKLVDNYSRFFTVDSCINKYINYVSQKKSDIIYKLLNVDYLNKNGITTNNILNYVDDLNGKYNFSSRKMYYEKIKNENYRFYVYGYLSEELIDTSSSNIEKYYIVNLYTESMLFDITPYNGSIFKEEQ